jgi:KilA-N domain
MLQETTTIETFRLNQYNGKNIRIDPNTRYVCLTDMATATGKLFADWYRLKGTHQYIESLSLAMGIPIAKLLYVGDGTTGAWGHPKAAIKFAAWCSVAFEVQVTSWIDELLTNGKVELEPKTQIQLLADIAQQMAIQEKIQIAQAMKLETIERQLALEASRTDELTQLARQHDGEIDRIFNPNGHYFSVMGYARNRGLEVGIESAKAIGSKCAAFCRRNGISIEKLTDPRFGTVGSYPESVIAQYI